LSVIFAPYPDDLHSYIGALGIVVSRLRDDRRLMIFCARNHPGRTTLSPIIGGYGMRVFLGMILGAMLLVVGVYIHDSQPTSTVASGQNASGNRTIVNWDVAAADWHALKTRAHDDWIRLSSR
jgi:hypothetical protein